MPNPEQNGPTKEILIQRRKFLSLMGGTVLAGFLGGDQVVDHDGPLPDEEVFLPFPDAPDASLGSWPLERPVPSQTRELLDNLQTERGTNDKARIKAAVGSIRTILTSNQSNFQSEGTAWEIDRSGIYITVRHAVFGFKDTGWQDDDFSQKIVTIKNPYTGDALLAKDFTLHPDADIAIVYAPTGQPPAAPEDLQISLVSPSDNENLWMLGRYRDTEGTQHLAVKPGRVVDSLVPPSSIDTPDGLYKTTSSNLVTIKGMVPYGGTSGSPIINQHGIIVGLERGTYPYNARTVSEYRGATMTPLSSIQGLLLQPFIQ